jgi:hypothetical protein
MTCYDGDVKKGAKCRFEISEHLSPRWRMWCFREKNNKLKRAVENAMTAEQINLYNKYHGRNRRRELPPLKVSFITKVIDGAAVLARVAWKMFMITLSVLVGAAMAAVFIVGMCLLF